MDLENRRKWAVGYAVLCILYFAVSVLMPHDRLESRGLEGIGKPSLKLKTEAITDKTELRFEYLTDAQAVLTAARRESQTDLAERPTVCREKNDGIPGTDQ